MAKRTELERLGRRIMENGPRAIFNAVRKMGEAYDGRAWKIAVVCRDGYSIVCNDSELAGCKAWLSASRGEEPRVLGHITQDGSVDKETGLPAFVAHEGAAKPASRGRGGQVAAAPAAG